MATEAVLVKDKCFFIEWVRLASFCQCPRNDDEEGNSFLCLARNGLYFIELQKTIKCIFCNFAYTVGKRGIGNILKLHLENNVCDIDEAKNIPIHLNKKYKNNSNFSLRAQECLSANQDEGVEKRIHRNLTQSIDTTSKIHEHNVATKTFYSPSIKHFLAEKHKVSIKHKVSLQKGIALKSVINCDKPKYPEYAVLSHRLHTFDEIKSFFPMKPNVTSEAGFFYSESENIIRCFFCGGGLRNIHADDDIWQLHKKFLGKCKFLAQNHDDNRCVDNLHFKDATNELCLDEKNIVRSPAYHSAKDLGFSDYQIFSILKELCDIKENGLEVSAEELVAILCQIEDDSIFWNKEYFQGTPNSFEKSLQNEEDQIIFMHAKMKYNDLCSICLEKQKEIVLLPCCHFVSCRVCSFAAADCPICFQQVDVLECHF